MATGNDIIAYLRSVAGQWYYSNDLNLRLRPEETKRTDCSGTVYWAYKKIAGITLGTWTGTQSSDGREIWRGSRAADIPWASMQAGDLILMTSNPSYLWAFNGYLCHIELYTGEGTRIIGSPGGYIPTEKEGVGWINGYGPAGIMVRRVLEDENMALTDDDITRIWQYHWAGDADSRNCYDKLANVNDAVTWDDTTHKSRLGDLVIQMPIAYASGEGSAPLGDRIRYIDAMMNVLSEQITSLDAVIKALADS